MSLHTLHSTLHTSYSILHTPHSTLSTPHSTLYTLHLTLQTLHFTLCTLHFTLCTLHARLHTLHSTLHTLHFTLRTPPITVYTLHCPPPTVMILSPLVNRKTSPCFATLRPPFLSITSHPLANYLVPNPNGRCSPLSFGVPPFSSVFPLLWTIFLHVLSFFPTFFLSFLHFPPFSPCFQRFSFIFLGFFLPFSCRSQRT